MEATEDLAGTRIRERSEKRVRAPWTYRCTAAARPEAIW